MDVVAGFRDQRLRGRRCSRAAVRMSTTVSGVKRAPTPIAARAGETRKTPSGSVPLGW